VLGDFNALKIFDNMANGFFLGHNFSLIYVDLIVNDFTKRLPKLKTSEARYFQFGLPDE
jgi:hypothetical protein